MCLFQTEEVTNTPIKCFAAASKNINQIRKSASADIFSAIATTILSEGGIVFGQREKGIIFRNPMPNCWI